MTDEGPVTAAARAAGPIDVLVNNAGVGAGGPLEALPVDQARRILDTNVLGPLRTIRAFVPGMRSRGAGP